MDLQDCLRIIRRYKWLIIMLCLTAGLVSLSAGLLSRKVYEAKSKILILDNQNSLGILDEIAGVPKNKVANYVELLKSRSLILTVADRLAIAATAENCKRMRQNLTVQPIQNTDTIEIRVRAFDPRTAQRIANTIVRCFIERNLADNQEDARQAREFIEEQLVTVARRLLRAEMTLSAYRKNAKAIAPSDEVKQYIEKLAEFEAERASIEIDLARDRARLAKVKQELSEEERTIISARVLAANPIMEKYRQELSALSEELAAALAKYTDKHPQVIALRAKIAQIQEAMSTEAATVIQSQTETLNPVEQNLIQQTLVLQADILAGQASLQALAKKTAELEAELYSLPGKEMELARLTREKSAAEAVYTLLIAKKSEMEISEHMRTADVRLVDPAYRPARPIGPHTAMNICLAVALGLITGAGLAFLLEYLDPTLKTREEAEQALGLPVFGMIPADEIFQEGEYWKRLFPYNRSRSRVAEAFRVLRTNIQFAQLDNSLKTILVTSAGPREGKSTTVANLGVAMAQSGAAVILVDGDLRQPSLHGFFRQGRGAGLTSVLLGQASIGEALRQTDIENLRLLTSGPIPPNPSEILGSQAFATLLDSLQDLADYILLDSPPAAIVADAALMAAKADGTLFVAGLAIVPKPMAARAKEQLINAKANLLGMVLTNVGTSADYRYYYDYFMHYGGKQEKNL